MLLFQLIIRYFQKTNNNCFDIRRIHRGTTIKRNFKNNNTHSIIPTCIQLPMSSCQPAVILTPSSSS